MKICRISMTFPHDNMPGAGLPGYYLAKNINEPTLYITQKRKGKCYRLPEHCIVKRISVFDISIPKSRAYSIPFIIIKGIALFYFSIITQIHMLRFGADIVHVHTPVSMLPALMYKYFRKCHTVITLHGSDVIRLEQFKIFYYLLNKFDLVFYVSSKMHSKLSNRIDSRKLRYTPSGVELDEFKDLGVARDIDTVAIGRFVWQKQYSDLVTAIHKVTAQREDISLRIIGVGPEKEKIKSQNDDLRLEDNIKIESVMSRNEILNILNRAKILVLTSVAEGFPKVILEAMACGAVVVATDVGSCKEVVQDAGVIADIHDCVAISNAIINILEDDKLRLRMQQQSLERVKQYDWKSNATKVYSYYREVL